MKRIVIKRRIRCASGVMGWQDRLKNVYNDFEAFNSYCEMYDIHGRLGYKTAEAAWKANPIVRGSTDPLDCEKRNETNCDKPSKSRYL